MEEELVVNSRGNRITISRAQEKDLAEVLMHFQFGVKAGMGTIYVARVNGALAGFTGYLGNELLKIEVSDSFKKSGPVAEELLKFSLKDYFARNKGMSSISLRAFSRVKKRQKALERWYAQKGALRDKAYDNVFCFIRPRGKETALQARERIMRKNERTAGMMQRAVRRRPL
jgi:hypothetical protein